MIIKGMHEDICGNHARSQALTTKIFQTSYFWPTVKQDCSKFMWKCGKYQRFKELKYTPAEQLHCSEAIKQRMARNYNKKVKPQEFDEGDFVLRKIELQRKGTTEDMECPFEDILVRSPYMYVHVPFFFLFCIFLHRFFFNMEEVLMRHDLHRPSICKPWW